MIRKILTILIWSYGLACVVALAVAAIGVFGSDREPLAAVSAIALALPWSILIWKPTGLETTAINMLLLVVYMTVNLGILIWLQNRSNRPS